MAKLKDVLTPRQAAFVRAYVLSLNATQAAVKAGYSKKTAHVQGCRLLRNAQVSAALAERQAKSLNKHEITEDRVMREVAALCFSNVADVFDEHDNLRPMSQLSETAARAIAGVEVVIRRKPGEEKTVEEVHKVKLWNKPQMLELAMKHLGLLKDDRVPIDLTVTIVTDARTRLAAAMAKSLDVPARPGLSEPQR